MAANGGLLKSSGTSVSGSSTAYDVLTDQGLLENVIAQVKILGEPAVGNTLTASFGAYNIGTVQWYRDNVLIPGESNLTYVYKDIDIGAAITARATSFTLVSAPLIYFGIPPLPVTIVSGIPRTRSQVLSWTRPVVGTGPITYSVAYRKSTSNFGYTVAAEGISDLTYTVRNLEPGTYYNYKVTATNSAGYSEAFIVNLQTVNSSGTTIPSYAVMQDGLAVMLDGTYILLTP